MITAAGSLHNSQTEAHMMMDFVELLQHLSFAQATIIIPFGLGLIVFLLPWLRNAVGIKVSADTGDGCSEGFSAIALFFVFLAATSLTTLQGYQKDGAKAVETELAHITNLDRDLVRVGGDVAVKARLALQKYVRLIITDEWPRLAVGESAETVDRALGEVASAINHMEEIGHVDARVVEGAVERLERMSDSREERIETSNEHLPEIYWMIIFGFLGMLLLISAFTQATLAKRVGLCGKMVALSFTLVLIVQTDGVFVGDISIKPKGYEKVLAKMKIRTIDSN
jgi:hypothetical protein